MIPDLAVVPVVPVVPVVSYKPSQAPQPNFLLEEVRYNARQISRRWAVLGRTAHWRDNSLAEVDDLLSQEISCQKGNYNLIRSKT